MPVKSVVGGRCLWWCPLEADESQADDRLVSCLVENQFQEATNSRSCFLKIRGRGVEGIIGEAKKATLPELNVDLKRSFDSILILLHDTPLTTSLPRSILNSPRPLE
jgi:hypothetical protein